MSGLRVDSGQVRALSKVTAVARKRQILWIIGATVLLCDYVFEVMPHFAVFLSQPTVFATLVRATTDKVTRGRVHLSLNDGVKMLASLELEDRDEVCGVDQCLVFRPLAIGQDSLVSPLGEFVHPLLHKGINLKLTNRRADSTSKHLLKGSNKLSRPATALMSQREHERGKGYVPHDCVPQRVDRVVRSGAVSRMNT